jgi:hypothetical protein
MEIITLAIILALMVVWLGYLSLFFVNLRQMFYAMTQKMDELIESHNDLCDDVEEKLTDNKIGF